MAKVRLEGAVNLEFEVKFGLSQDITLTVHAIDIESDGKAYKVLVGEGDISDIPVTTLEFIGSRIECFLKEENGFGELFRLKEEKNFIVVNGFRYGYTGIINGDKIKRALFKTDMGKVMLKAYEKRDEASLKEVLNKNLWFVSRSGLREFAYWKKVARNITLDTLLNGRSITELTGEEAALASELLTELVKRKPLTSFTDAEYKALIESLTEYLVINLFNGDEPENWAEETLDWIENHPAKNWGCELASIIDLQLYGIEAWDSLTAEESQTVAEEIVEYLENQQENK